MAQCGEVREVLEEEQVVGKEEELFVQVSLSRAVLEGSDLEALNIVK